MMWKKKELKGRIVISKADGLKPLLEQFISESKEEWERTAPDWLKQRAVFDLLLLEDERSYIILSVLPWGNIPFFTGRLKKKIAENVKNWLKTKGYDVEVKVE